MGEHHSVFKPWPLLAHPRHDRQRHTRKLRIGICQNQRHERGCWRHNPQTEFPRQPQRQVGRSELGNGQAARCEDHRPVRISPHP